jgi:transposase
MKRWPLNGSAPITCCALAARPSNPLRLCGARHNRKGAHTLAALAQEVLGEDPFSGAVIVYRAKRSDRIKILVRDTNGLVLIWKQLQDANFRWPPIVDGTPGCSIQKK